MLQYPRSLAFDEEEEEKDQEESSSPLSLLPVARATQGSSSSDDDDELNFIDATMSAVSLHSGVLTGRQSQSPHETVDDAENRLRESLLQQQLTPRRVEFETVAEQNARQLSHVQHILRLSKVSCERMAEEGIESVNDLYAIEALLRHGSGVPGLKSVETAKLLQFLGWARTFRSASSKRRGNEEDDGLPDVVEQYFTRQSYERYQRNERSQQGQDGIRTHSTPSADVWPFQLELPETTNILQYPLRYVPDDDETTSVSSSRTSDLQIFVMAELDLEMYQSAAGTTRDLSAAMSKFRSLTTQSQGMLAAFARIKLSTLYHRMEFHDAPTAMHLLQHAAVHHKVPTALFFYGHARVTGRKGVEQNIGDGLDLLGQAAAAGVGEAYFVLAYLYEEGRHGVGRDGGAARLLYRKAAHLFARVDHHGWRGLVRGLSTFSTEFQRNDAMTIGPVLEHWHDELGTACTTKETGRYQQDALYFGVQTILLVAAAMLGRQIQLDHYPILVIGVPVLGALSSCARLLQQQQARHSRRPRTLEVQSLWKAKLQAYQHLLGVDDGIARMHPLAHSLYMWHRHWKHVVVGSTSLSPAKQARVLYSEAKSYHAARLLGGRFPTSAELVAVAWCLLWLTLLYQEVTAFRDDCSEWFASVCEAASTAVCTRDSVCHEPITTTTAVR